MTAGRSDRGPVRIRRRGRHTTPSQVEKVALQAGKAAPAVAIAGALVAAPQISHALASSAKPTMATARGHATAAAQDALSNGGNAATAAPNSLETRTVTVAAAKPAKHAATAQSTYYSVRNGDTLATIADKYYGNAGDWQYLFHVNEKTVANPDQLNTGERLFIPAAVPANFTLTNYTPKHAKPPQPTQPVTSTVTESTGHSTSGETTEVLQTSSQGTYSCSSLEQLWEQAGGNSADAFMAAEIAMAESGGNPNAISPTDDYGLWQINASNGALATLNPSANAKSAVILSANGTNWGPWTTYTSGAYSGKC